MPSWCLEKAVWWAMIEGVAAGDGGVREMPTFAATFNCHWPHCRCLIYSKHHSRKSYS